MCIKLTFFDGSGYFLNIEASCRSIDNLLVDAAFLVDFVGVTRLLHATILERVDVVGVNDLRDAVGDDDDSNVEEEIKKLEADLKYAEGFLQGVLKKLSNERFVNNAPQNVVDIERKKQSDAEEKIRIIKEQLAKLKS